MLHTVVDSVRAPGSEVETVTIWNKAGRNNIRARQWVDCTGDGDLAAYAGAPVKNFAPPDPGAYSAGFTFRLVNVDLDRLEADLDQKGLITQVAHAVKPGMSKPDLVRLGIDMTRAREMGVENTPGYFLSTSIRPREITYCNCINYGPNDGLDADALTRAEVYLRAKMLEVVDMFRKHFDGCQDAYAAGPAPSAGQRRGRAVHTDYELTMKDCTLGRQFDDQIGCFGFIDNSKYLVENAGAYGIPYRALIARGLDNVLVAGRMMTVDLVAHNSTRNTVCALICGQAAGTAAAYAARYDLATRQVDVDRLRSELWQAGALLEPRPDPL
jgi:hypothetical protein